MLFHEKYKPTCQKNLFHKDIVTHIRKWLKHIDSIQNSYHILFVYGPIGCAKSITIDILLKGYHIHNIDPLELRSYEKAREISTTIPSYNDFTLSNIESWGKKKKL